jgi:type I restriction-modification system DNA methylase subunit
MSKSIDKNKKNILSDKTLISNKLDKGKITLEMCKMFESCINLLRNKEHIVGRYAMKTFAYILLLRLLEPKIRSKEIDIESEKEKYNISDLSEEKQIRIMDLTIFSNILKEKKENLTNNMIVLWNNVLSKHSKLSDIFVEGGSFGIKKDVTYFELIDKLAEFPFEKIEHDIQGLAYEEQLESEMTGKVFGQFFTPTEIKQIMVELVNPKILNDGKIETIYDPAMGTGGFLITAMRHYLKQSKLENKPLDLNFIKTQGLCGREIETDTFNLCKANMLISTGLVLETLEFGDTINRTVDNHDKLFCKTPILNENKYDIILTNPPYGIKGLDYNNIQCYDKEHFIPIKSNSAVPLFLQSIIYMLKIGGRCALLIPDGQELFSNDKTLCGIRQYLMKICDLKQVIYIPSNTFEHTSILTCILHFEKKCNHKDKYNKDKDNDNYSTSKVKFYNYQLNLLDSNLKELGELSIKQIIANNYNLKYSSYFNDVIEIKYDNSITVKKLTEISKIKVGKNITKELLSNGPYPVVGGGQSPLGYHNKYNVMENQIIISKDGAYAGFVSKYNTKIFLTNHGLYLDEISESIDTEYLYYHLKLILQEELYKLQTGTAQPGIKREYLDKIRIVYPSIEIQKNIVEQLNMINDNYLNTKKMIIDNKNIMQIMMPILINRYKHDKKMLSDICEIKYGGSKISNVIGKYPLYGGGINPSKYIDEYNVNENTIIIGRSGNTGIVTLTKQKSFVANYAYYLILQNNLVDNKYVYYYLKQNELNIQKLARGLAQKNLNRDDLNNYNILVPSLEDQQIIIQEMETIEKLIVQLENQLIIKIT